MTVNKHKPFIALVINSLMFLMGLNFMGNAIFIVYVLALFTYLFVKGGLVVPKTFFTILLLYISIVLSEIINSSASLFYAIIKNAVYPVMFVTFYKIGVSYEKRKESLVTNFFFTVFCFTLGNIVHMIIDMSMTDLSILNMGNRVLNDIWSAGTTPTTIIVGWGCFVAPVLFCAIELKKRYKVVTIVSIIMVVAYASFSLMVATRLGIANIFLITIVFAFLMVYGKKIRINQNTLIKLLVGFCLVLIVCYKLYPYIMSSNLYLRLTSESLQLFDSNGRIEASIYVMQHFYENIWGGGYFTAQYGIPQHNIWFQLYDLYGLIPFVLFAVIMAKAVINTLRVNKIKSIEGHEKRFIIMFFVAIVIYCFEEPAYTSNFVISSMWFVYLGVTCALLENKKMVVI